MFYQKTTKLVYHLFLGVADSGGKVEELEDRISQLEAARDELEVSVEKLTKEKEALEEKAFEHEEKNKELTEKNGELEEKVKDLEKEVEELRNELDDIGDGVPVVSSSFSSDGQDVEVCASKFSKSHLGLYSTHPFIYSPKLRQTIDQ